MKRLDLYILRECLPTFFLSLAIFSFALMIQKLSEMFDLVVAKGVPVLEVLRLLLLAYPALLALVLPASLLLAVLLAMSRLSADSEVVVMRSLGVGLRQNLKPVLALSAAVMVVCLIITLWLGPLGRREFKLAVFGTILGRLNISTEAGVFTEITPGMWLYAEKIDQEGKKMEGMFLHTGLGKLAGTVVTAREGSVEPADGGMELKLVSAEFHRIAPDGSYTRTTAQSGRIFLPVGGRDATEELSVREFPTGKIYSQAFIDGQWRAEMEFYRRFTVPISCLMLGALGGALGCHHFRTGNSRGFALSMVVLFLNYALFTLGDTLARRHVVPVAVAMWIPVTALAGLTWYAVSMKNSERELSFENAVAGAAERIRRFFAPEGAER